MASSYRPSPLAHGSPRASSFRRPESPHSPSPLRQSTPVSSPTKVMPQAATTPSRLTSQSTVQTDSNSRSTRVQTPTVWERELSPTRVNSASPASGRMLAGPQYAADNNSLSRLQPAQVRELREVFQILDRDSDGVVSRDDVADMLNQLGLPAQQSDITEFFPPSTLQNATLPTYLSSLAALLAALSPPAELLSAFSAFDEDDSGQIDLAELKDALLHTAPDQGVQLLSEREVDKVLNGFVGRRAFSKQAAASLGKRGDVFRYQEFVSTLQAGSVRESEVK